VTKNWWKKRGKPLFQKHTNNASKKMLGKKSSQNIAKKRFFIHTNIVTKKWWKKRAKNFSRNTPIVQAKNVGKKSLQKSTICCEQKMLGKKRRKNCEKTFLIFTRIS